MPTIYGYLLITEGRSLFVRNREDIAWADEDDSYDVKPLIAADEVGLGLQSPDFESYKEMVGELFEIQQAEIDTLKGQLEEFVEVMEAIVEVAVPTDNVIENRAKLMLVNEQCKKLLAAKES